jgi:hypothetical protein
LTFPAPALWRHAFVKPSIWNSHDGLYDLANAKTSEAAIRADR